MELTAPKANKKVLRFCILSVYDAESREAYLFTFLAIVPSCTASQPHDSCLSSFPESMCSNKKWLLLEVYREVFSGQSPWWQLKQLKRQQLIPAAWWLFPAPRTAVRTRCSTSRRIRNYYHCVYVSGGVSYTSDVNGGETECTCGESLLPEDACVNLSECFLSSSFLKSAKTCVNVLHRLWEKINPQPELPTKLPFSRDGTCQSPYWVARTWGPPASRRHRGWRGAVSLLVKQPRARP